VRPKQAGEHACTASKLCAVLTARYLSAQPDIQSRHVTVIAYDPGAVFGTGLTRDLAAPLRFAWSLLGTPVGAPLRWLNDNLNTRAAAGHALADLAAGIVTPAPGRTYAALRRNRLTWPDPSDLGRRDHLSQKLWEDSARLVGWSATPEGFNDDRSRCIGGRFRRLRARSRVVFSLPRSHAPCAPDRLNRRRSGRIGWGDSPPPFLP
jgi:hypothetical protein